MNVPGRMLEMTQCDLFRSIADCQFGRLVQQKSHGTGHSVADPQHELDDVALRQASKINNLPHSAASKNRDAH